MRFFSQASRMGRLSTALGEDVLALQRFEGSDFLNGNFEYRVACLAGSPDIDFNALLGTHASVALTTRVGTDALFDGIVTEARGRGAGENGYKYELTLQPWFHLASMRRNHRIFHNKTVVEILTELLAAYARTGRVKMDLWDEYPELEYTVQYRESDMAFACRLMERHGISYHFKHSDSAHEMVLSDRVNTHATLGPRPFKPYDGHHQEEIEHFWAWRPARRLNTGSIRLTDYNFKTPTAEMEVDATSKATHAHGQIESFDWPGDHLDQGRGDVVARLRLESEDGQTRRFEAEGDIPELRAGSRVELDGSAVAEGSIVGAGEEYLCLVAHHSYTSDNYGSGGDEGDGYAYTGRYVLLPADAPMVPELKTPRADVKGPQTAVVVGEGEIDCDEFGRILIRFHWDLEASISMRCRVSQNWSGNGFGGMVIPRIGMEVVVEFLDGDPDKPLVTGCVYNGKNAVPYELPEHKTRSTFKTDTHEDEGFNELRFEDKAGDEEIFVHAQKDMSIRVKDNRAEHIGGESVRFVRQNEQEFIGGSFSQRVLGDGSLSVGFKSAFVEADTYYALGNDGLQKNILSRKDALRAKNSAGGSFTLAVKRVLSFISKGSTLINSDSSIRAAARESIELKADKDIQASATMNLDLRSTKATSITAGADFVIHTNSARITLTKSGDAFVESKNLYLTAHDNIEMTAG